MTSDDVCEEHYYLKPEEMNGANDAASKEIKPNG